MGHDYDAECEECGVRMFQAGESAPPGAYLRVDDDSFRRVEIGAGEKLPPSYDGHVALYRLAARPCVCQLRRQPQTARDAAITVQEKAL